jgi:antitoxin CptB
LDDRDIRLKRLRFRSWHRGTREADMLVGGFFDRYSGQWDYAEITWYEMLMDEQDVDILAWAMGTATPPVRVAGSMMHAMQQLDYIEVDR